MSSKTETLSRIKAATLLNRETGLYAGLATGGVGGTIAGSLLIEGFFGPTIGAAIGTVTGGGIAVLIPKLVDRLRKEVKPE